MAVKIPKRVDPTGPDTIVDRDGARPSVPDGTFGAQRKRARIRVGGVYVTGDKASAEQVKRAVATSADMLERLGHKIARPGFRLKVGRNIPLFSADPDHPDRFLRKLNGKIERGVLQDGAFKVVD